MGTRAKRDLPSPTDRVSVDITSLRTESLQEQLSQLSNKKSKANPSGSSESKHKIKIIISEHSFTKPYKLETINSSISNFEFLSIKSAYKNDKTIICEVYLEDLDKVNKRENWNGHIQKLIIDKKSAHLDSICVNKIKRDKDTPPIPLNEVRNTLSKSIFSFFNLRYENNLIVFETLKDSLSDFEIQFTIDQAVTNHSVRKYDPVDNYIVQCRRCHVFGHMKSDCKKTEDVCAWCGKTGCGWKCDPTAKKCVNCNGKHSAQYKGCKVYKRTAEKASITRTEKQHNKKITNIEKRTNNLQKSYADAASLKSDQTKNNNDIKELQNLVKNTLTVTTNMDKKINSILTNITTLTNRVTKIEQELQAQKLELSITKSLQTNYVSIDTFPLVFFDVFSSVLDTTKMAGLVDNLSSIFIKHFPDLIHREGFLSRIQDNLLQDSLASSPPNSPSMIPSLP